MEVLDYNIPPFKTMGWVSDKAKETWNNRFEKINGAIIFTTLKALVKGDWDSQYLIVEGWSYFKILELAAPMEITVKATFLGNENVKGPVYYEVLLTNKHTDPDTLKSSCCIACTTAIREKNRKEHVWQAVLNTKAYQQEGQILSLSSGSDTSVFWQRLLVTIGTQHRCSLQCKRYASLQEALFDKLQVFGYEQEALWLSEMYSWPVEWCASHGICELRTPIIKLAYDTDPTAIPHTIRVEGDNYPTEGAPGKRFPYRKRKFLRITDSKSFKAGLQHGS
ncbi:hypothetical protein [Aquimarina sp. MMG016]|uniref:hypothetical protein n=1 Tax=Aquimarina sp. MMG016 TaxID=2822690 RepID=UPI001B39FA54|nr:hypothetical protein [Aquimarina sp. MMG016]MBQ4822097.1 hypothetical protein [Aquimarina sp. MMG016]